MYSPTEPYLDVCLGDIIHGIEELDRLEIEEVMDAVQDWFRSNYPLWEVVYIAMPKDPAERKQHFINLFPLLARELHWTREEYARLLTGPK